MAALTRLSRRFSRSSLASISRFLSSDVASQTSPVAAASSSSDKPRWVLVSCPGVGRATYATRLSNLLGVPHISASDLLRHELTNVGPSFHELVKLLKEAKPVTDEILMRLLSKRLEDGEAKGESGFLLHGFPYSIGQAEMLEGMTDIDLVVNLKLPEHVLIEKYLGARVCTECNKIFSEASIAPVLPPEDCMSKLTPPEDYTEEGVKEWLRVNQKQRQPVEEFYRSRGKLLDFDLSGGGAQSWPRLLQALNLNGSKEQQFVEESIERVCGADGKAGEDPGEEPASLDL